MKHFTPEEDQFLRDNYLTIPAKRMSKMLGRTEGAARQRMERLNVMMPTELRKKLQEESRYQKGHTPCNKGKKQTEYMSREMIEKTIATRFKKGHKPHNTIDKNGAIRIRIEKINEIITKNWYARECLESAMMPYLCINLKEEKLIQKELF